MPLFDYSCPRCGQFERLQSTAAPLRACPGCGGPVERLPSAPAIQFKGEGWFCTQSRNNRSQKE